MIKLLVAAAVMVTAVLAGAGVVGASIVTSQASLIGGQLTIVGSGAVADSTVTVDNGTPFGQADAQGDFSISASGFSEPSCLATLFDGSVSVQVTLSGCTPTISPPPAVPGTPAAAGPAAGASVTRAGGPVLAASCGHAGAELPLAGEHPPQLRHRRRWRLRREERPSTPGTWSSSTGTPRPACLLSSRSPAAPPSRTRSSTWTPTPPRRGQRSPSHPAGCQHADRRGRSQGAAGAAECTAGWLILQARTMPVIHLNLARLSYVSQAKNRQDHDADRRAHPAPAAGDTTP